MFGRITKWLALSLVTVLCLQLALYQPLRADSDGPQKVKELNFVFLHGIGSNPCAFQLMADQMMALLPGYINRYQEIYPDTAIEVNTLDRCYPGYVDIAVWAQNVAESIEVYFAGKSDIILIGHSMGGKTALYIAARNTRGLSDRIVAVVTINSPIKSLRDYYVPGGGPMEDYCRTTLLGADEGVCNSLAVYDSSEDGLRVSQSKHWLAFISAEATPLSPRFDRSGFDIWPRNLDDGTVPLSAQFSEGADVIYYGEYGHSEVAQLDEPAQLVADQILRYIFGDPVDCSVITRSGSLEHEADWLLGTDRWSDVVGGIAVSTGNISHRNGYFYKWQDWEDIVGACTGGDERAYSYVRLLSAPVFTGIREARWLTSDNSSDCRLYVKTRAGPLTSVLAEWVVYESGRLAPDGERTFYDVEISEGTPLASITYVAWMDPHDPLDPLLRIWSEAQSPFRWFRANWRIYQKAVRQTNIIHIITETPR